MRAVRLTDEVEETLLQLPDLGNRPVQLPKASNHDVHPRILARPSFLQSKPRQSQQQPDTSGESDENTQPPVVPLLALIHPQPKHDPHNHRENDNLAQRLDVKSHITDLIPLHGIGKLVLLPRHLAILVLARLLSQRPRVAREARKRGGPVSQTQLVGDQAYDVQS